MAKSNPFLGLRGKIDGKSYYAQKGVDGTLVRSINEGMSNRVKNDAAFANTRLNMAEFGAAGSFSGAVLRTISKKWRTILAAFATGSMSKFVVALIKTDSTNPWGQRVLSGADWADAIRERASLLVKNSYAENFSDGFNADNSGTGNTVKITPNVKTTDSEGLLAKGVEGVLYEFYQQKVGAPQFDIVSGAYTKPASSVELLGSLDAEIGQAQTAPITSTVVGVAESSTEMVSLLVVALPYRVVNNTKYTMQELCSCTWKKITING